MHMLSPTGWIVVAVVSALLASGSGLLLATRGHIAPREAPGKAFDTVEQFVRDTIRLSFKDKLMDDTSSAVFVAPRGILNQAATFKWVENTQINEPTGEEAAPIIIAPPRVLDPTWVPQFSGIPSDKKTP